MAKCAGALRNSRIRPGSFTAPWSRFAIPLALSLALSSLSGATAFAGEGQPPSKAAVEEAKKRLQRGRELYEESDFRAALAEFRRAHELAPTYKLLFDIGQICYQLQDYPCALQSFTKFLEEGRGQISAQQREDVQKEIDRLQSRVATLRITTNVPEAEVTVDDVSVGKSPLSAPVVVSAGKRKITATLPGRPSASRVVEVAGTDSLDVRLEIAGAGEAQASADGDRGGSDEKRVEPSGGGEGGRGALPIVLWSATGALAVATGITGVLALGASSDLSSKLDTFGATRAEVDDARSKTRTLALVTDVLLGVTVAAAGASLYFTLSGGPESSQEAGAPSLRVGVGLSSLTFAGTF